MPDEAGRRKIWENHLPPQLPLTSDVNIRELAQIDDVCGRDIKNAVIDAALSAARSGAGRIRLEELSEALLRVKSARIKRPGKGNLSS